MRRERTQVMNKSILLVDDSLPNLKLTRFLLMQDGFEVRTAENAEQALQALEKSVPDMILMDIQMPGMDGLALTRHLRRDWDSSLRSVPIVALTASAIKGDERDCAGRGMRRLYHQADRHPDVCGHGAGIYRCPVFRNSSAGTGPAVLRALTLSPVRRRVRCLFKQTSSR